MKDTYWVVKKGAKLYWGGKDIKWTVNINFAKLHITEFSAQVATWNFTIRCIFCGHRKLKKDIKVIPVSRTTTEIK